MSTKNDQVQQVYPRLKKSEIMDISESPLSDINQDSSTDKSTNKDRIFQIIFDIIAIAIVFLVFILIWTLVSPTIAYFYCNDTDIYYPYKSDTVEFWVVGIYGFLGPVLFIILVELKNSYIINFDDTITNREKPNTKSKLRNYFICVFHALSLFMLGIGVSLLITEVGKRWIGRLRPYFMDVCKPVVSQFNCTSTGSTGFIYNAISTGSSFCTGDAKKIAEARLSFPSGHASFRVTQ